ncbi:MAG: S-layer homology domain-containing protein [Clostridia bacterium]|nr:S-layer homology domain-containing protein [Clostridia bacterium]
MKKILSIILCFLFLYVPVSAENLDTNILPLLKEMKIMEGDPDGNLRLDDYVSRGEFCKVAIAASQYKNSVALNLKVSPFKDVTHRHWASPYIKLAVDHQLITGYPDGSFRPDSVVLYEEALTVFLKLLGYDSNDFGNSWPYGQVGLATNIGLCDHSDLGIGARLTRRDVAVLVYELLNQHPKNSSGYYIESQQYKIVEESIILGTPMTDSSVGSGRVNTTAGNYKTSLSFEESVGKKGELIIKNSDEIVGFIPSEQQIVSYPVYQILDDEIVVYDNGVMQSLSVDTNLTIYHKSQTKTLKNTLSELSVGDTLTLYHNENQVLDYGVLLTEQLQGPITAISQNAVPTDSETTFIRDGVLGTGYELYDVLYYSKPLNTVWAYSKKISGIYESAAPNRDNPTSVVISGVSYALEGSEAFFKLSSQGSCKLGDSITVLLGKDGKIADVMSAASEAITGYLTDAGKKTFQSDKTGEYSSYYVTVVTADGETMEYATDSNYDSLVNKIVRVGFQNGRAKVTTVGGTSDLEGIFRYQKGLIGSKKISSDLCILDVSSIDPTQKGNFIQVYPQRLDGVTLTKNNVLYYEENAHGEIIKLFLYDVTGDIHQYGVVTQASDYGERSTSRSYTYDINGQTATVNAGIFPSVTSKMPCKFVFSGNSLDIIQPLVKLNGNVSDVTDFSLMCQNRNYQMSDRVVVYEVGSDYKFMKIAKDDFIKRQGEYQVTPYYDKSETAGGRIRVLIVTKKDK